MAMSLLAGAELLEEIGAICALPIPPPLPLPASPRRPDRRRPPTGRTAHIGGCRRTAPPV